MNDPGTQKIAFTICSLNYLSQAKALGNSLLKHNSGYHFIIGLVDKMPESSNIRDAISYEMIEVGNIGISGFAEMCRNYNVTELNTAVKPFIINYLLHHYTNADTILYFDPDILIYNRFEALESALMENDIVLTPHITAPITDDLTPAETAFLNTGLYNLGFIAVKRSETTSRFITWWMDRLRKYCFVDFQNGLFVDQIWINFVPLFYKRVHILYHPGYNMAYWNLQERKLSIHAAQYLVNGQYPLVFFHFSGYQVDKEYVLSKYQDRFSFKKRPDLIQLFADYSRIIMNNDYTTLSKIQCAYFAYKEPDNKNLLTSAKKLFIQVKKKAYTIRRNLFHQKKAI